MQEDEKPWTPPTTSAGSTSFSAKEISSPGPRDAGSFIRDLAGVHAHAYQSSWCHEEPHEEEGSQSNARKGKGCERLPEISRLAAARLISPANKRKSPLTSGLDN